MKKFLLSIFAVMLAVFSVQAQDVVLDFTTNDWGFPESKVVDGKTYTYTNADGYTVTVVAPTNFAYYPNGNYFLFGKTGAVLTLPVFDFAVSKIEIVGRSGASTSVKEGLYAGDTKLIQFVGAAGTNVFEIPEANQAAGVVYSIKVESNSNAQITKINIYKAAAGGEEVVETVATPIITPETTTFNEGESVFVSIATETQDAEIYYTLDGTDPSTENGELYEGEIEITETTTVKAIAVKEGWNNSEVAEAKFTKVDLPDAGEAAEVTGNATVNYGTATINTIEKFEVAPVTLTFAKNDGQTQPAYNKAGDCRIYAKGSITATCSVGNLTKIVFTISAQGKKRITDLTPSTGTVTIADDHSTVTWEGNAAEVVLTVGDVSFGTENGKAGQICFTEFTATYVIPSYTLTVTDAGWATLFLDFAAEIPQGVKAYVVSEVNTGYVTLNEVTGVIPAKEAVIVEATPGNYDFVQSTNSAAVVEKNLLEGTLVDTNVTEEAYVLWNVDGEACFCKADVASGSFLNKANKAYLPATVANGAASYSFRFGEGTTGVEEVKTENGEVKTIYDLTGRRVEAITVPGIYIVGGKKVLVK